MDEWMIQSINKSIRFFHVAKTEITT